MKLLMTTVLFASVVPAAAVGHGATIDAAGPVNNYAPASSDVLDDTQPTVAADGSGRVIAAWWPFACEIMFATSTDRGVTWSEPALLKTNVGLDNGFDFWPAIATGGNGTWVAVWASLDTLGGTNDANWDILATRSTDDGATWSAPVTISPGPSYSDRPTVATDGNGRWVAAWGGGGIRTARSTDNGTTWQPDVLIPTGFEHPTARIATDGNGTWNVVWYSTFGGGLYGGDEDIFVARSTNAGQSWSLPMPVNTDALGPGKNDWKPEIAVDAAGTWIVAWEVYNGLNGTLGNDYDLLYARSTDGGVHWSNPAVLNSNAATDPFGDYDEEVKLRADGNGNWLAAWRSLNDQGLYDIFGARSSDGGVTWTEVAPLSLVTDSGAGDQYPQLATDGLGNWLMARQSAGIGPGFGRDILANRLRLPFVPTCATDGDGDGHGAPGNAACPLGPSYDCDDANPAIAPGAVQSCDTKNNDCDHPAWPALAGTNESDDDGDGRSECAGDCLDSDLAAWSMPSEATLLVLERQAGGVAVLHWQPPLDAGGDPASVVYDVLRSEAPFACNVVGVQTCLESDEAGNLTALDPLLPASGKVLFYLVRAENGCPGTGQVGPPGNRRVAVSCPQD